MTRRNERGGIDWHTQGSAQSLTMLWLCLKLRRLRKLDNPTLLLVTDRRDLDRQITETFLNCGNASIVTWSIPGAPSFGAPSFGAPSFGAPSRNPL